MQIITTSIQKGGTAKTTTAAILAQAAASKGKKVLAIDLDPQGNLSLALAANTGPEMGNTYNLLMGFDPETLIQTTAQGLDIIPADLDLSTISSGKGSARRLQRAIRPLEGRYDLIVIDSPATAGELQYNALQAANGLIIPLQADVYSVQSLYQITDAARQIQKSNPDLSIIGVLITRYDGRSTIARMMKDAIIAKAEEMQLPYLGTIRNGVAVQEAAALQRSLFEYAPKANPAADYMAIYEKIAE